MSGEFVRTINPPEGDEMIGRPGWRWDQITQVLVGLGAMLLLAGVLALITAARDYRQASEAAAWPSTPGVITVSDLTSTRLPGRDITLVPWAEIAYTYEVDDRTYTGGRVALREPSPDPSGTRAEQLLRAYPMGADVTVFFNPDDPTEAVLERANSVDTLRSGLVLLAASAVVLLVAWIMRRVGAPGTRTGRGTLTG